MVKDYRGPVEYSIEIAIERIGNLLKEDYPISKRSLALLVLQEDREIIELVKQKERGVISQIQEVVTQAKAHYVNPIPYELALERQNEVRDIIKKVVRVKKEKVTFREGLSRLTMNPITGIPILLSVLYWGVV